MKSVTKDNDYQRSLAAAMGVMVFGHDATIALFRHRLRATAAGPKLKGFGSALAATVVAGPPTAAAVAAVVKDIVSLAGQGCLASRFVACVDHSGDWLTALDQALAPFRPSVAADREIIGRWLLLGFEPPASTSTAAWGPWRLLRPSRGRAPHGPQFAAALREATGDLLPIIEAVGPEDMTAIAGLKKLALADPLRADPHWTQALEAAGIELCPLGQLNGNPLTGRHLGQTVF